MNLFHFFKKVRMSIGQPLTFTEYYDRAEDGAAQKKVLGVIMSDIAQLAGKKYNY
jgi:hypothetical protein